MSKVSAHTLTIFTHSERGDESDLLSVDVYWMAHKLKLSVLDFASWK